jgi:hypothetical protein
VQTSTAISTAAASPQTCSTLRRRGTAATSAISTSAATSAARRNPLMPL